MAHISTQPQPSSVELAEAALDFAREAHLGQRRKQSGDPFVDHLIDVERLLAESGCPDSVLAAAYLHDVVEKTDVDLETLRGQFGTEVGETVEALTEDEALPGYGERKRALRRQVLEAGRPATVIYAADRLANLRDWIEVPPRSRGRVASALGTSFAERLALWQEDLAELTEADAELPFLAAIEVDLARLSRPAEAA